MIFGVPFWLEFYTSLHLASLGSALYKILALREPQKTEFPTWQNEKYSLEDIQVKKILFLSKLGTK